jgi:hypothetical protein
MLKQLARLIIILAAFVGILYFILPTIVNLYLNKNAERIVSDMITRTGEFAGHDVHFGEISFNYDFSGTLLRLRDVDIAPGEALSGKDKIRFHLSLDEANLTGFVWTDFLFSNSIRLDTANLENMVLESITPPIDSLHLGEGGANRESGRDYDLISVAHIRMNQLSFNNKDSYTDSIRLSMADLFVFGDNFRLSKEMLDDPKRLFAIDHIQGYMASTSIHFNDYRNAITAENLSFDIDDQKLEVENVVYRNKLGKYEYVRQFDKETNWMEVHKGKLDVSGMDFRQYFQDGVILARHVLAEGIDLEVFRDKRMPDDTEKRPKMIHEIIASLPMRIAIDTISVDAMKVTYEERPDNKAPRAGSIYLDEINATISPFTNFEEKLAENDELKIKAEARFMGTGKISVDAVYFVTDKNGRFTLEGRIGPMDLKAVNQMIEPATQVALKNGKINEVFFTIKGNDFDGTGEVIAKYENLEIEILDKNFQHKQNVFRKLGAFLANKLVIKSQNPNKRGELKKGAVYERRNTTKFIFHYWWQLLLSGLKSTITGDTEEELREKAEKK